MSEDSESPLPQLSFKMSLLCMKESKIGSVRCRRAQILEQWGGCHVPLCGRQDWTPVQGSRDRSKLQTSALLLENSGQKYKIQNSWETRKERALSVRKTTARTQQKTAHEGNHGKRTHQGAQLNSIWLQDWGSKTEHE